MGTSTSRKTTAKAKKGKNKTVITVTETTVTTVNETEALEPPQRRKLLGNYRGRRGSPGGSRLPPILAGLGWNAVGQLLVVLVNLGLTPFLLTRLGVDRYGVFAVLASFRGLLSNLDGGIGPTATRYFAVYAGSNDRKATSSLLLTISCMIVVVSGSVLAVAFVLAPQIAGLLRSSPPLHRSAVELLRLFMPLMLVTLLQQGAGRVISAQHRWRYLNAASVLSVFVYAGLVVLFVGQGQGLIGWFWATAGQEAVLVIATCIGVRRFVNLRDLRLLPWLKMRELGRYARRVQVAEVANSFNLEIDALLVGLLFPIHYVAFYSIGSNFASQLINLPMNADAPIAVTLSRTFGSGGLDSTLEEFAKLQRLWVRAIAAFPLIGAASAYFAIARWLGPKDQLAGVVAAILLLGQAMALMGQVMDSLGKAVNLPGLESRYLGVGMIVNIVFTVPLALTIGMIGVPIGTSLGLMASSLYFLHIARREIAPDLQSFLSEAPVKAIGGAIAVTLALEFAIYPVAPAGAPGLIACALPAGVGLGTYLMMTFGAKSCIRRVRTFVRSLIS